MKLELTLYEEDTKFPGKVWQVGFTLETDSASYYVPTTVYSYQLAEANKRNIIEMAARQLTYTIASIFDDTLPQSQVDYFDILAGSIKKGNDDV